MYFVDSKLFKSSKLTNDHLKIENLKKKNFNLKAIVWCDPRSSSSSSSPSPCPMYHTMTTTLFVTTQMQSPLLHVENSNKDIPRIAVAPVSHTNCANQLTRMLTTKKQYSSSALSCWTCMLYMTLLHIIETSKHDHKYSWASISHLMHNTQVLNLISWKKMIDHSWLMSEIFIPSLLIPCMHLEGVHEKGEIRIIVRHMSHLGCEQCLRTVQAWWRSDFKSQEAMKPEAPVTQNCLCLPFFLFCFVEFFCELLLDERSLVFVLHSPPAAWTSQGPNFRAAKNYGEKRNAKNETKLGRGKNLQENLWSSILGPGQAIKVHFGVS